MPYGEEPITSFFLPLRNSGKHKENARPVASTSAKRKRGQQEEPAANHIPAKTARPKLAVLRDRPQRSATHSPPTSTLITAGNASSRKRTALRRASSSSSSLNRSSSATPPPVWRIFGSAASKAGPMRGTIAQDDDEVIDLCSDESQDAEGQSPLCNISQTSTPSQSLRPSPARLAAQLYLQTPPPTGQTKGKSVLRQALQKDDHLDSNSTQPISTPTPRITESSMLTPGTLVRRVVPLPKRASLVASGSPKAGPSHTGTRLTSLLEPLERAHSSLLSRKGECLDATSDRSDLKSSFTSAPLTSAELEHDENADPCDPPPLSQVSVPSSQTQESHLAPCQPMSSELLSRTVRSPVFKLPELPVCSDAFTATTSSTEVIRGRVLDRSQQLQDSAGDDLDFQPVPSSQSQLVLPFLVSPQRKRPLEGMPTRTATSLIEGDDSYDFVPSSQSQEKELSISTGLSQLFPARMDTIPNLSSFGLEEDGYLSGNGPLGSANVDQQSSIQPPIRTLSEELFAYPTQDPEYAKQFDDDLFDPLDDVELPPVVNHNAEDSATESDTDHEGPPQTSPRKTRPVVPKLDAHRNNLPKFWCSQVTAGSSQMMPSQYTREDTSRANDNPSSQAAHSQASLASLPDALKDFRDMFDSQDGSYPDDFPMSLR